MILTKETLFSMVARANGLKGRQKVTGVWSDGSDKWIFGSNARGGYGETLTFHYETDEDLMRGLGFRFKTVKARQDGTYEAIP